jgi:hypothetical protein
VADDRESDLGHLAGAAAVADVPGEETGHVEWLGVGRGEGSGGAHGSPQSRTCRGARGGGNVLACQTRNSRWGW